MTDTIEYNKSPDPNHYILKAKELDLEAGLVGKLFGASKNAPMNIAGVVVIALVITSIATLFIDTLIPAQEVWKLTVPVITLVMGFLFGKGSN